MGRLTKWLNEKKTLCIEVCEKECVNGYDVCHKCEPFKDVVKKLADYEDAEEQGLLLRLPCQEGTEVWAIEKLFWIDRKGCKDCLYFGNDGLGEYCDYIEDNYPSCTKVVPKKFTISMLEDIGKTVFLTREEAEQALKKMGE